MVNDGITAANVAERLLPAVRQVMMVGDYTSGSPQMGYAARFRGRLALESRAAYAQLAPAFRREGMTLLFRTEGDQHVALASPGVNRVTRSNPWVNLVLFVLTVFSVLLAGELYGYDGPQTLAGLARGLPQGIPFAASLMAILLAHEFGHYLAARLHKTAVSLPYYLPFPLSYFGTLGAFIQLKEPPRDRRVLLDIGLAGPIAGLVVAIPLLFYGLALSKVERLPLDPRALGVLEGNSILYLAAKALVKGQLLPAPVTYGGLNPLLYWIRYLFMGLPLPLGGRDVMLNPVAWAAWAGLLVTALNLIPAGQLDGGHLLYVLIGRRAQKVWPFLIVGLVLLGFAWPGWLLWAGLIFLLGRTYAKPLDEITPLDGRRKALAVLGLVVFVLVFMPVPLRGF